MHVCDVLCMNALVCVRIRSVCIARAHGAGSRLRRRRVRAPWVNVQVSVKSTYMYLLTASCMTYLPMVLELVNCKAALW